MTKPSAHEILGVPVGASFDKIIAAYVKTMQALYSEKDSHLTLESQALANNRVREITSAYEELRSLESTRASFLPYTNKETFANSIESFFSFAGFTYGETVANAERILGRPEEISDDLDYSFITQSYFQGGLLNGFDLDYDRISRLITGLTISSTDAVFVLKCNGVDDPNFSYLRQHWDVIQARFGEPNENSSHGDNSYDLRRNSEDISSGIVTFTCYDHDDYICSRIGIQWFYDDYE